MLCKVIQLLCIMVLLAGCRVVTPPADMAADEETVPGWVW